MIWGGSSVTMGRRWNIGEYAGGVGQLRYLLKVRWLGRLWVVSTDEGDWIASGSVVEGLQCRDTIRR